MTDASRTFDRRQRIVLTLVCIALGAASVDISMVTVAVPSIHDSLHIGSSGTVWIVGGLSLVMGLTLIPAGRIGDRIGHRVVFIAGLLLFSAGSLWAGLAPDEPQIIVARVIAGLGAGMIFPSAGALIQLLFTGARRAKAFGARGAVISACSAFGGVIAGVVIWLAGPETGWRWLFLMNVPIALAVAVGALWLIPRIERPIERGIDVLGLLLLIGGTAAILVPIVEGEERGWPWWMFGLIGGGVLLLVVFGAWEARVVRAGRTAIVPPALFSHWTFTGGLTAAFLVFAASTSFMFALSITWQGPLGRSAVELAVTAAPFALGAVLGSILSLRIGARGLLVGCLLASLGIAASWLIVSTLPGPDLNAWVMLAPTFVAGIGQGIFIALIIDYIIRTVPPAVAGGANGLVTMVQRLGAAVGVAVIAVVFAAGGGGAALGACAIFSACASAFVLALPRSPKLR